MKTLLKLLGCVLGIRSFLFIVKLVFPQNTQMGIRDAAHCFEADTFEMIRIKDVIRWEFEKRNVSVGNAGHKPPPARIQARLIFKKDNILRPGNQVVIAKNQKRRFYLLGLFG